MTNTKSIKIDKKEKLLEKLKGIQSKIDSLEQQRAEKIMKLAKKFDLFDLSDKTIAAEFALIKAKYALLDDDSKQMVDGKKN